MYVSRPDACRALSVADRCRAHEDHHSSLCRSKHCVIATSNFQADRSRLQKLLQFRHVMYQHSHQKPMSCTAMAQMLSNTLYNKRFFPYYCYNMVCGLDGQGEPCSSEVQNTVARQSCPPV